MQKLVSTLVGLSLLTLEAQMAVAMTRKSAKKPVLSAHVLKQPSVEADRQKRFKDLGGAVRCVMRAHAAPLELGAEEGKRQAAGASSAVGAGASSMAGAASNVAVVGSSMVAADIGEAGGVVHVHLRGSFSAWPHQDRGCPSNVSTLG
jgi:hypothetical protein